MPLIVSPPKILFRAAILGERKPSRASSPLTTSRPSARTVCRETKLRSKHGWVLSPASGNVDRRTEPPYSLNSVGDGTVPPVTFIPEGPTRLFGAPSKIESVTGSIRRQCFAVAPIRAAPNRPAWKPCPRLFVPPRLKGMVASCFSSVDRQSLEWRVERPNLSVDSPLY